VRACVGRPSLPQALGFWVGLNPLHAVVVSKRSLRNTEMATVCSRCSAAVLVLPVDKGLKMSPSLSLEHDQKVNQCCSTDYQGRGAQLDPNQGLLFLSVLLNVTYPSILLKRC